MSKLCVTNHIADYVLSASESGSIHTNRFATTGITITLPSIASEGTYFYLCSAEYGLEFIVALENGSHQIWDNSGPIAGQSIYGSGLQVNFKSIMLTYNGSGKWLTTHKYGVFYALP